MQWYWFFMFSNTIYRSTSSLKKTPLLIFSKQMRMKNAISELEHAQQPEKNDKLNSFPQ